MLRFASPLTPAATAIFVMCLDLASDEVSDVDLPDALRETLPALATCFTSELARATLVALVEKLRLPQEYVPTDYHWLLLYECLQGQIEGAQRGPPPSPCESPDDTGDSPGCALSHVTHPLDRWRGLLD